MQCCLIAFIDPRKQITTSFGRDGGKIKVKAIKLVENGAQSESVLTWSSLYVNIGAFGSGLLIIYFHKS